MKEQMGNFFVSENREVTGSIRYSRRDTRLYLWDREPFSVENRKNSAIQGVLHNLLKVSLFGCVVVSGPGSRRTQDGRRSISTTYSRIL